MQYIVFLNNSVLFCRKKSICTIRKAAAENCKQLLSSNELHLNKSLNNHFQAFLTTTLFYRGRLGLKRSAFSLW